MAPSMVALDDLQGSQSPAEVEDGFYQDVPHRTWYARLSTNLRLMPLERRPNHYLRHPYPSEKSQATANSLTDIDDELCRSEPLPSRKYRRSRILKTACTLVPVVVLSLLGVLHILQVAVDSLDWQSETNHQPFLLSWGEPGGPGAGFAHYPTDATRDVLPIPVHSHNDYWRRIPLYEALHYGCVGVEADVWLIDDELFVGHSTSALAPNRTFKSLYVDPLSELLDKQNPLTEFADASRRGVYDKDPDQTLVLLVDLKTDGASTLAAVEQQIDRLRSKGYLTHFNGTHTIPGAITVVGTGNTPFDLLLANSTYRDIFFDAPLDRLWEPAFAGPDTLVDAAAEAEPDHDSPLSLLRPAGGQGQTGIPVGTPSSAFNSTTSYYASVSFRRVVGRVWGRLSSAQLDTIRGQIRGAKKRGLKVRYWDTPDWPISLRNHVWHVLVQEGADILNADDLQGAATEDWRKWRHEWW